MSGIWVISDLPEVAWELLTEAKRLQGELGGDVTAFVAGDDSVGQETIQYGADKVQLMAVPEDTKWEEYVNAIKGVADGAMPKVILVAASKRGKELAARLAALLDAPCVTECSSLQFEGADKVIAERMVLGGLAIQQTECTAFPLVATIGAKTFEATEKDSGRTGDVSSLDIGETAVKVVERRPRPAGTVNIADAEIVVGVGRGFGDQANLSLAEELAEALGGAIGCSRPVAEDLGWLPEETYIGISGQVVKPTLYLCAGVSGQVQHVSGIRDSKLIVSIDKNENAPIFDVSDYYIVGDLKEVLPALTKAIKAEKGN